MNINTCVHPNNPPTTTDFSNLKRVHFLPSCLVLNWRPRPATPLRPVAVPCLRILSTKHRSDCSGPPWTRRQWRAPTSFRTRRNRRALVGRSGLVKGERFGNGLVNDLVNGCLKGVERLEKSAGVVSCATKMHQHKHRRQQNTITTGTNIRTFLVMSLGTT